ncbi:MAG: hypothetical protein HEQ32_07470 [Vampirovibrio sp.]
MLFSKNFTATFSPTTLKILDVQRTGGTALATEQKSVDPTPILSSPASNDKSERVKEKKRSSESPTGFKQRTNRFWKRWKNMITFVGSSLGMIAGAGVVFVLTQHHIYNHAKVNAKQEGKEIGDLSQRYRQFKQALQFAHQNKQKPNSQSLGFDLLALYQDALNIYSHIAPGERGHEGIESLQANILRDVLSYAFQYEQDALPSLITELSFRKQLTNVFKHTPLKESSSPFSAYIRKNTPKSFANEAESLAFQSYQNDRLAIDLLGHNDCSKEAQALLKRSQHFSISNQKQHSHFQIACMLDLYATYFQRFDKQAAQSIEKIGKALLQKEPHVPSTLTQRDLYPLAKDLHLPIVVHPLKSNDLPIYFVETLHDLLLKRMELTLPSPQNAHYNH